MRIIVDFDGCIAELLKPWLDKYQQLGGEYVDPDTVTDYNMQTQVKKPKLLQRALHEGFHQKPIPGAIEAIKQLQVEGHEIVFLTYCVGDANYGFKRQWLDFYLGPWAAERLMAVSSPALKRCVSGDVLIEDSPENIAEWCHFNPWGQVFCIEQPYNAEVAWLRGTWSDFIKHLKLYP